MKKTQHRIIDAHTHLGVQWHEVRADLSPEACIELMDRVGIEAVWTSASRYLRFDFQTGNQRTLGICNKFPNRVYGFCLADPHRVDQSLTELDRYLGDAGFIGVKIHISHTQVPYNHPSYYPIYERTAQYRAPILAHTFSFEEVNALMEAALQFPDIPFMVGHAGGFEWEACLKRIASVPNAYFDMTGSIVDVGRVEAFVNHGGAERVLFGSDLPFLSPQIGISQVNHAALTKSEKQRILRENALSIQTRRFS
jgi:uncharacterized protein